MADITTTRIFTDGERGITAAKLNDIVGSSTIQPAFYSAKPVSSTLVAGDKMLALKSTGSYAQADFQSVIDSVSAAISSDAEIWSVRLRSFSAVGNPNFEVDQRNAFAGLTNPPGGTFIQDRWAASKAGTTTMGGNWNIVTSGTNVPGTSFAITKNVLRFTLLTQQASLGAGDTCGVIQTIEGTQIRELLSDVTSISLLVRSSVAGLKFAVSIRDSPVTKSMVKLCTIPTASVWTLVQLNNIPIFPAANFGIQPGQAGCVLGIFFAVGSSLVASAADTWQNGQFVGAPGMDNFGSKPVNSIFDVAFVQFEPGPVCSTFMDRPFIQNLDECLRYYCKSYSYPVKPGSVDSVGIQSFLNQGTQHPWYCYMPFKKVMAKVPTVTGYSPATGAAGVIRNISAPADLAINQVANLGDSAFAGFQLVAAPPASLWGSQWHYVADTGW